MVVDLEGLGAQRLELADLGLGLEVELLAGGSSSRGDPDDVAVLAHVEAAGLQDDVERLIPRDILEAQVRLPRTESLVMMLKLVKSAMTCSTERTSMFWKLSDSFSPPKRPLPAPWVSLLGSSDDRLHLEDELVVALVGVVLPLAARGDRHAHVAALALGQHRGHRRAEIDHVELATELSGTSVLRKSTIRLVPCWRMSMPAPASDRSTTSRPRRPCRDGS